jgi:hypothetical protein
LLAPLKVTPISYILLFEMYLPDFQEQHQELLDTRRSPNGESSIERCEIISDRSVFLEYMLICNNDESRGWRLQLIDMWRDIEK